MHAKELALLFVCTAACDGPANKGTTLVPDKGEDAVQREAPVEAVTPETKPVTPEAKAVTPETTPERVELTEEEGWDLVRVLFAEGIGPIKMDMPASEVIAAMGKPKSKGKELMEGATGDLLQPWTYKGVTLDMVRESKKATRKVGSIQVGGESGLATKRGIRVGSTRADVARAYAKERNAEDSDELTFVAGSVYGGLLINFENDVVTSMFLGAAAE
jgi:hypothetical protein